jgi:hypothetical protein
VVAEVAIASNLTNVDISDSVCALPRVETMPKIASSLTTESSDEALTPKYGSLLEPVKN